MTDHRHRAPVHEGLLAMFAWQGFMEAAAWTEDESDTYGGQIGAWSRCNRDANHGAVDAEARHLVEQFFNPLRRVPSPTVRPVPA
jgi:hypothetical protein